jgi:glycosyltransferase involved in cell wall biosynthesis
MTARIKVLHIISNLNRGGAEAMLQKVISASIKSNVENTVISIIEGGLVAEELRRAGLSVYSLGAHRNVAAISRFSALKSLIRELSPDLLQGWMYHANIAASVSAGLVSDRRIPVVWNVRQSVPTLRNESALTTLTILAGAPLSYLPRSIIYNSVRAAEDHERILYSRARRRIIPNGFDTELFRPRPGSRGDLIRQLKLPEDAQIIGRVANFHHHKDFKTLFDSFAIISQKSPRAHLALIGGGLDSNNRELAGLMTLLPSTDKLHILGERSDVANIMPGFDVLLSSSSAEAFPNVIGEAMASAVPVVTTDAGDCREILSDPTRVVSCRNAGMLANSTLALLSRDPSERAAIGMRDRERIISHYSIEAIAHRYVNLWRETIRAA